MEDLVREIRYDKVQNEKNETYKLREPVPENCLKSSLEGLKL